MSLPTGPQETLSRRRPENRKQVLTSRGWAELVYCINCGAPGGAIFGDITFVVYLCPKCEAHGKLPLPELEPERIAPLPAGTGLAKV